MGGWSSLLKIGYTTSAIPGQTDDTAFTRDILVTILGAACFDKGLVGDHELYGSLRFWCVLARKVHLVMHHKHKTLCEARYMFTRAGFGDSMCAYKVRARHASYVRMCSRLFLKSAVWGWHVSIQGACSRHASVPGPF